MQLSEIRTETRYITRTDTNTFSNTDLDRAANLAYQEIMLEILKVQGYKNVSGKHVSTSLLSTSGLIAGDLGFNGEYPFPTDLIRPTRIELLYDTASTPKVATLYDMSSNTLSETDEDDVVALASTLKPVVRFFHDSYFIRPVKTTTGDITSGINIWYEKRVADLTNDTDEPEFDAAIHGLLPVMIAERFYMRHPDKKNKVVLDKKEELLRKLRSIYKLKVNVKRQVKPLKTSFA